LWRFDNTINEFGHIFQRTCAESRNGYLGTSSQKSDPAIRSGDLDFL